MISPPEPLLGVQRPRIIHLPPAIHSSLGQEFIELSDVAGLYLDDWQQFHVRVATATGPGGLWAAREYADVVPRQNGKGGIIECLTLGFLYLLKLPLTLHSAHLFPTSEEAFKRVCALVENCPELTAQTMKPRISNGKEGLELTPEAGGSRLRYMARSKNAGRGFSAQAILLDEAFSLSQDAMSAIIPTVSAQANPWIGYFSSAALATSTQLHALRRRALAGDGSRLAYLEHSVDPDAYGGLGSPGWEAARRDPRVWAIGNPAQCIRISVETVETELATMSPEAFDRERLGVPDPEPSSVNVSPIDADRWAALADPGSEWVGSPVGVVDVSPDGSASMVLAGVRADGLRHVELVDNRPGVSWVEDRRAELSERYGVGVWVRDPAGPAVELAGEWRDLTGREYAEACAGFLRDVLEDGGFRWRCSEDLERVLGVAVANVAQRPRADGGWLWSRKLSTVDISPVVALTVGWLLATSPSGDPLLSVW